MSYLDKRRRTGLRTLHQVVKKRMKTETQSDRMEPIRIHGSNERKGNAGTHLIVDDHEENIYLLRALLRKRIWSGKCLDGSEALKKARQAPPDMIVTDILMPVMDGYTLCREWKSDDLLKHIPLIFYTATYTKPKDEEFALSLGADRFVIKPQEPHILMKVFREVLDRKRSLEQAGARPLGEEMEFFRQYNEILFEKLEKKISDLETANKQLSLLEEKYR